MTTDTDNKNEFSRMKQEGIYVSDRTPKEFAEEFILREYSQIEPFFVGKTVVSVGGGLFQRTERKIAEVANHIHVIEPSLGFSATEWCISNDSDEERRSQGVSFLARGQIDYRSDQIATVAEFEAFQKSRIYGVPENMSLYPVFLPGWPGEIKDVDIIVDMYGPAYQIKNPIAKIEYVLEALSALAVNGLFVPIPADNRLVSLLQQNPQIKELERKRRISFKYEPALNNRFVVCRVS